ncbi:glycosyltransferase family 2 protein [Fulvivirga ulvae]|uniref:glycosyltransferase family 2 protein n=1 Tax=Fulvivirga ulvae TaxID=2904245 RepID=UPI001F35EE60|nr:glycosyltransferase family 2 protein [Fulvivirga ulvae]UII30980.1 glycosyltransferase family 2 protein [Fulvivirga ulvae]
MNPITEPLVSIVSINYNSTVQTKELLESLRKVDYKNLEIIIVDNGSANRDIETIVDEFPEANFIMNPDNLGFAGGNNVAIKEARGEYVFFVNNDAELTPDCIQPLLETFRQFNDAGAVSPKFHYFSKPGVIEYAGYSPISAITGRNDTIGANEKDQGQYDQVSVTHYTHGGGMMVPKKVIDEVGPMPEEYFLYYEEFDWCEMMKKAGYKIYYQPKALVCHKVSASIGQDSTLKTYYLTRNRILFMRRNKNSISYAIFLTFLMFFTIPKNVLSFISKGKYQHLSVFWKAITWNFGVKKVPQF